MDTLSHLSTVVFDKTGTLTEGIFAVEAVHPDDIDEQELLHLAAHVERFSTHPIAMALRAAYPAEHDSCKIEDVEETAGEGISALVNGRRVYVGNEKMMERAGAHLHACTKCVGHAGTVIHIAIEAADVVLMDDKPHKIAMAVDIARRTIAIAHQNAWFAIVTKILILVLVGLGLLGSLAMPVAVFGDVGVMVLCVLNATRALK